MTKTKKTSPFDQAANELADLIVSEAKSRARARLLASFRDGRVNNGGRKKNPNSKRQRALAMFRAGESLEAVIRTTGCGKPAAMTYRWEAAQGRT